MAYMKLYRVFSPLNTSEWLFLPIFPLFLVFPVNYDISHLMVNFTPHGLVHTSRFPPSHLTAVTSLLACFFLASLSPLMFHLHSLHVISTLPQLLYSLYIKTQELAYLFTLSTYEFFRFILHLFLVYFAFI